MKTTVWASQNAKFWKQALEGNLMFYDCAGSALISPSSSLVTFYSRTYHLLCPLTSPWDKSGSSSSSDTTVTDSARIVGNVGDLSEKCGKLVVRLTIKPWTTADMLRGVRCAHSTPDSVGASTPSTGCRARVRGRPQQEWFCSFPNKPSNVRASRLTWLPLDIFLKTCWWPHLLVRPDKCLFVFLLHRHMLCTNAELYWKRKGKMILFSLDRP